MVQVKVTDQATGEYGVYELDGLADSLTVYGTPAEEVRDLEALEAALRSNDMKAIEELSIRLGFDAEWV